MANFAFKGGTPTWNPPPSPQLESRPPPRTKLSNLQAAAEMLHVLQPIVHLVKFLIQFLIGNLKYKCFSTVLVASNGHKNVLHYVSTVNC